MMIGQTSHFFRVLRGMSSQISISDKELILDVQKKKKNKRYV